MSYITLPRQKVINACHKTLAEIEEERSNLLKAWENKYDKEIQKQQKGFFGLFKKTREEAIQCLSSIEAAFSLSSSGIDYHLADFHRYEDLLTVNKLFKLAEACYDDEKLFINDEHILVISKYLEK